MAGKDGSGILHTFLGTEGYMAPEINLKSPYNGSLVDLFASAIILFIMYSGHPPFKSRSKGSTLQTFVHKQTRCFLASSQQK